MLALLFIFTSVVLLSGLVNDVKVVIKPYPILSIIITTILRTVAAFILVTVGFIIIGLFVLLTGNNKEK